MNINQLASTLTEKYNWNRVEPDQLSNAQKLWFLVACIATSADAEDRVFAFLNDVQKIEFTQENLKNLLSQHGIKYAGAKAKYIVGSVRKVVEEFAGVVPENRKDLESLPGVGRHIASVILATLYNQHEFAVDYHVRRVFKRLNLTNENTKDIEIERMVQAEVPAEMWGHFSRSVVDFGQDVCGMRPRCEVCPLNCPSRQQNLQNNPDTGLARQSFEVKYVQGETRTHAVTVRQGKLHCTCKGFRFRKTCKHVKEMVDVQA